MSLKKRLLHNGLASILSKGVRVLEQLFLVPFFITAWGAAYYGEWLTLTIIPSVIAFSDLGFGTAAANSFVLSYAAGDKQKAADISKTGMYMVSIMVGVGILLSLALILTLNYFKVFDKALIDSQEAIIAVSILIVACLLNFYNQLIESYYRSAQKAALAINLFTTKAACNLGAGLVVLLLGYGIVPFALSQLMVIVVFNIIFWLKGKSLLPFFKTYQGNKDKTLLKQITTKGLGYLLFPAWQAIYFQGTTFAVRIVLGPEAVAIFNTVRTLSRSVNQLLNIVSSSVFPELQYEIGQGNTEKAQKIYRFSIVSSFFIAFLGVLFLAFFGLWFYKIWTKNELIVPPEMWYIFVLGVLFNAFWWSSEPVFRAKNEPYTFALTGVVVALISVVCTYFFSIYFGLAGAAFGALMLDILMALIILPLSAKMLNMTVLDIFSNALYDVNKFYQTVKSKLKIS